MQTLPTFGIVLGLSALVALPSILAIVRKHRSWLPITVVNVLFGWTIIGWIAALVWVLRPARAPKQRTRRRAQRRQTAKEAAANDNVSVPTDINLPLPADLESNFYEEWLDQGSALPEVEAKTEAGSTVSTAKVAA